MPLLLTSKTASIVKVWEIAFIFILFTQNIQNLNISRKRFEVFRYNSTSLFICYILFKRNYFKILRVLRCFNLFKK